MKNLKLKNSKLVHLFAMACITGVSCSFMNDKNFENSIHKNNTQAQPVVLSINTPTIISTGKKKIKIALLLDTSNSMDGLIDQAKSQLWKLVNELSSATCDNEKPELELALYEYGNDNLPSSEGYVRQVSLFTNDLDLISEKLFSLTTNGGSEFCGYAIHASLNQLDWKGNDNDLRIIFIAGNESFHQGPISSITSCNKASEKDVIVNTIYCGPFNEGLNSGWKTGSMIAKGEFMSIEQDRKTVYIESPYDTEIAQLNDKINETYISYGSNGYSKKTNQEMQDKNARSYGSVNTTNRIVSKTSSFYSNASWDIVDASKEKEFDITKIKESDLPTELKGKTKEEKEQFIANKKIEREIVKNKIIALNKQRTKYILEKEKTNESTKSLDEAMLKAIKEQAIKKKFIFES